MVKTHHNEKKTIKAAQHKGTQERRSGRLFQSVQSRVQTRTQKKTCRVRDRYQKTDSFSRGCISTQRGAREVSCLESHGPAAVWRSMLRDLPQGDRVGQVRRQGSVVTIDMEALTCKRRTDCLQTPLWLGCPCIHPVEGHRPHEFIFATDYCGERESGGLVNT